jgi:selenocysteine lyase/cysteine desulfurase
MLSGEFAVTERYTYFNTAAIGPWPKRTVAAVQAAAERAQFCGPDTGSGENALIAETRARLARVLGAHSDDFAFGPDTTFGLNVCTHGIDWRAGDNIVLPAGEFPSVRYALAHLPSLGVEIRAVPRTEANGAGVSVGQLLSRIDARTRAVMCSAISWDTGFRIDLEELGAGCSRARVLSIVDGIHAVGAEPLDLRAWRISALAFHSYKWLMAGFGNAGLYVAPEALAHIRPTFTGPLGIAQAGDPFGAEPEWMPGARRFGMGNANQTGMVVLNSSLTLIEECGLPRISAHNHALADALDDGIRAVLPNAHVWRSREPAQQSAIVVFTLGDVDKDKALVMRLEDAGIIVAQRPAGIRVAPHLFNQESEVAKLLRALQ